MAGFCHRGYWFWDAERWHQYSCSSWLAFATEGTGFGQLFPGIKMHVLTLTTNLRMPFLREYLLLHGLSDVSRGTCIKILKRYTIMTTRLRLV